MEQEFKESSIPSYVWSFAKKHSGSLMAAGILAFIMWQYLKKHQSDEGYNRIDNMYSEDNDMSNSGDVVGVKMIKKDEEALTNYTNADWVIKNDIIKNKNASVENEYIFTFDKDKRYLLSGKLNKHNLSNDALDKWTKYFKKISIL